MGWTSQKEIPLLLSNTEFVTNASRLVWGDPNQNHGFCLTVGTKPRMCSLLAT
jgi:hypothetical protein